MVKYMYNFSHVGFTSLVKTVLVRLHILRYKPCYLANSPKIKPLELNGFDWLTYCTLTRSHRFQYQSYSAKKLQSIYTSSVEYQVGPS